MDVTDRTRRRDLFWQAGLPALIVGACGAAVVFLRPALPIDETRYLEVLRESLSGNHVLLHLRGKPYAEKPPLLFWLAELLSGLGLSPRVALRLIPGVASALTVLFVGRVGRRAGLALAGWTQASLLLAFLVAQVLFFDALLACGVWGAVDAWSRGRDRLATLGCAFALLAKGPVAFLFLVPFFWSLAPLRSGGKAPAPSVRRLLVVLLVGLVPLVLWAVAAAVEGGPDFARALLWERWAGRVVSTFAHRRSTFFYVPVVLFGSLPVTLLLLRRLPAEGGVWARRLVWSLGGVLLAFTLISGKQAHYLIPWLPGLALLGALQAQHAPSGLRALRIGVRAELLLFTIAAVALLFTLERFAPSLSDAGRAFVESGSWKPLVLLAVAVCALSFAATFLRLRPVGLLAVSVTGLGVLSLTLHRMAGPLVYPYQLERALDVAPDVPVARFGSHKNGLFELFTRRDALRALSGLEDLRRWGREHPGGLIVAERAVLGEELPEGYELVAREMTHNDLFVVLRAPER